MTTVIQRQMVEINLNTPNTPEEREANVRFGNIRLGQGAITLPYIDGNDGETIVEARQQTQSGWAPVPVDDGKPHLRYFSVGPTSYQICCPLCKQRADTEIVQMGGVLGSLSCLLSMFSCCFPIFSLGLVYLCLQSRLKSKRMFCNKCGGYLGFYRRPT